MERSSVLPSGVDAHAAVERALLPVPATIHRTLREPGRCTANGREFDQFVERQRESQIDAVAEKGGG